MNSLARHVTSLSAYRKPEDHLTKRTVSGAIVTVLGVLAALVLFVYEARTFKSKQVVQEVRHTHHPQRFQLSPSVPS